MYINFNTSCLEQQTNEKKHTHTPIMKNVDFIEQLREIDGKEIA